MAAVLGDHLAHVLDRAELPILVPYVLPAGYLGENEYAQLVARVDEALALGVMARPNGVKGKLLLHYARVLELERPRRRVAYVRPALMPVEPAHEVFVPIQVKPVGTEIRRAEAEPYGFGIDRRAAFRKYLRLQGVELRIFRAPRLGALDGAGQLVLPPECGDGAI